jgi:hypothetical protein
MPDVNPRTAPPTMSIATITAKPRANQRCLARGLDVERVTPVFLR